MTFDQFAGKEESPETVARRLKEEIDSWRPYAEALRQEDREVFREMMNSCGGFVQRSNRSGRTGLRH